MTDGVSIDATEVAAFAATLGDASAKAGARAYIVVRQYGQLAQTNIRRRASQPRTHARGPGTGGPRLITGDYVRSIALQVAVPDGNPTATIGTNKPQGRRLELGFVGVDAANRHYNQPPYEHFGPGLADVADPFTAAIAAIGGDL